MHPIAPFVDMLFSVLTIIAQLIVLLVIAAFFIAKLRTHPVMMWISQHALVIGFTSAFLATGGSLVYSEIIGYTPCTFCWFQRIFMYPQIVLFGMALYLKDSGIKLYGIVLSLIGAAIALFHYLGQIGVAELPCSAVGASVSLCEKVVVLKFGYITLPLMAFSAFVLTASVLWYSLKHTSVDNHA